MHTHLVISVLEFPERQSIVEVLRILRVDSKGQCIPEILSALEVFFCDFVRYAVRSIFHLRLEPVWQTVFCQDGMHFGIIGTRLSEHIHKMSLWVRLSPVPTVHKHRNLESGMNGEVLCLAIHRLMNTGYSKFTVAERLQIAALRKRILPSVNRFAVNIGYVNADVVRHHTALHEDPCLISYDVENSHKWLAGPFNYLKDNTFLSSCVCLFLRYGDLDSVGIESAFGLTLSHIDIIIHALDLHKDESVSCHLDRTDILRIVLFHIIITAATFFREVAASASGPASETISSF